MPATLNDKQESYGAGTYLDEFNIPANGVMDGTVNLRLQPTGSLRFRLGHNVHSSNAIGKYSTACTLNYASGAITVGAGTAPDFTANGVDPASGGGSKWLLVLNGTAYVITAATSTTLTITGLAGSGSVTSGNWYVAYIGPSLGTYRWYKESDPTTHYELQYFGKRLDRIADDGSITILKADLTDITGTGRRAIYTQMGDDVVFSNFADPPVFINPGTGSVTGQNSSLSAPSDPLFLFSYYDSSIPTAQSIQTGQGFQRWKLARQTKGGGAGYGIRSGLRQVKVNTATSSAGFNTANNGSTTYMGGRPDRFLEYDKGSASTEHGAEAYQYNNPFFMVPGTVDGAISTGTASLTNGNTTATLSSAVTCSAGDIFWCDNKWYRITSNVSASTSIPLERGADSATAAGYTYWIFPNKFAGGGTPKLTIHGTGFFNGGEAELDSVTWGSTAPQVNDGDVLIAFFESSYTPTGSATGTYTGISEDETAHGYGGPRYLHKMTLTGAKFLATFKMEASYRGKNMSCWQVSPDSGVTYYNTAYWDGATATNPGITDDAIYYWKANNTPDGVVASGNLRIRPQVYQAKDSLYTDFPQSGSYSYVGSRYGAGNVGYRIAVVQGLKNDGSSRKLTLRSSTGPIYQTTKFALIRGLGASASYAHLLFKSGKAGISAWDNDTFYSSPTLLGVGYGTAQPTLGCAVCDQYANTWNDSDKEILTQSPLDIPIHKVSCVHKQRVVYGNIKEWDTSNTRRSRRFDYGRLNNIAQLEGDPKEVGDSGLVGELQLMFSLNDTLFAVLDRGMFSCVGPRMDQLQIQPAFPAVGCVAPWTAAFVDGLWVWLDSNGMIWSFDGSNRPRDISNPIKKDIEALTPAQLQNSAAFAANGLYYLCLNGAQKMWIYDQSHDPGDQLGGGWMIDDHGFYCGAPRRGGTDTSDYIFASTNTYSASALQYLHKGEVPAQYNVDYWTPGTPTVIVPKLVTRRMTTQAVKDTKIWRKFAQMLTSQTSGTIGVAVDQDMGDGTWNSIPFSAA